MAKKLPITNYDTMPQVDRVVVIAAGPSAKKAMSLELSADNIYHQPGGIKKICSSIMEFVK